MCMFGGVYTCYLLSDFVFSGAEGASEPRFVFLERSTPSMDLGMEVIGGNAAGIFVHEVEQGSAASGPKGLQRGDHILEVLNSGGICNCYENAQLYA